MTLRERLFAECIAIAVACREKDKRPRTHTVHRAIYRDGIDAVVKALRKAMRHADGRS